MVIQCLKGYEMYLEFKRKELEDADAMRDAQRTMAMVLSIWHVIISIPSNYGKSFDFESAENTGDMAGVYFITWISYSFWRTSNDK